MSEEAKALDAAYHAIRHVTRSESPWAGVLAQDDRGSLRLLVDAGDFGDHPGWDADPHGHVLAPLDVARRPDGHDIVLPACSERVDAFIARRRDHRVPLSAGERVTVAVSIVRGLCEAQERVTDAHGDWWLTADGRPVLALDARGGAGAAAASARLLTTLSVGAEGRFAVVLSRAAMRAEQPRALMREAGEIEADLFACAQPEALGTEGAAAHASGAVARVRVDPADEPPVDPEREGWLTRIVPLVDADLADAASRAALSVWRKFHRRGEPRPDGERRSRKGPLLLAGAAAAAVVGIGLVWPGGAASPAQAGASAQRPDASVTAEHTASAGDAAPAGEPASGSEPHDGAKAEPHADPTPDGSTRAASADDELLRTVDELLTRRTTCADDASCLRDVQEDPQRRFEAGPASLPSSERRISLLDSFGGAAVLKAENANAPAAGAAGAQLVVVVQDGDRWLLRDVYGAQQPG